MEGRVAEPRRWHVRAVHERDLDREGRADACSIGSVADIARSQVVGTVLGMRNRKAATAAGLLAVLAILSSAAGAGAVTSRTSEGVGAIATPAPQPSAGRGVAAAARPASAPAGPGSDLQIITLALVAAGGFGRGSWLLRARRPEQPPTYP